MGTQPTNATRLAEDLDDVELVLPGRPNQFEDLLSEISPKQREIARNYRASLCLKVEEGIARGEEPLDVLRESLGDIEARKKRMFRTGGK